MEGLYECIDAVNDRMMILEAEREHTIAASRTIIRSTKRIIHGIHVGSPDADLLESTKAEMLKLVSSTDTELLFSGPMQDAMMEFAEACLLDAAVSRAPLPSFGELAITPQAWAMGLADCLGEMRRIVLTMLMDGRLDDAKAMFADMDEMYNGLMMFDVPDAILPIRRKQDVARGVMERTRTDLANAIVMSRRD